MSLNEVPTEIYLHILSFVGERDLGVACARVSCLWRDLTSDDSLWRRILDRRHPNWQTTFKALDVDPVGMTALERVRFLQTHHDPVEKRECCQHDQNTGARCQCCVCVRHHAGQQWDAREHDVFGEPYCAGDIDDDSRFNPERYDHQVIMFEAYDSRTVTIEELRSRYEAAHVELRWTSMPDFDRVFRVVCEGGALRTFGKNRVAWTKQAHRTLRPPLLLFWFRSFTYSDADLTTATDDSLRGDIFDGREASVLARCEYTVDVDTLYQLARRDCRHLEDRREFDRVLENLARTGWIRLRTTGKTTEVKHSRAAGELLTRDSIFRQKTPI
ncbi:F-box domain-containing protein [Acanthamoeba castellanii medusavirus]|uniref:F-box domain-containing protein n=1 Tax=Acanthamoeba castellanii medusavirus J1 TaxID=3114988 RepID=A0A3T1CWR1_9VIRU|nr:F-box domain-containing protein [Acanthamoeba castellanii medusavirus]BBI30249.1 F-box domain-containing protein [Acanthamoeba castellanii medusavirus J1]